MPENNSENFNPVIAAIIPFHGNKNDLSECLKAIQNQNFDMPFEIIIIESKCDYETKQFVRSIKYACLISSSTLLYPGKARNLGASNSKAELLAFIDADCIPSKDWLSEIYYSLKNGNEIVIGPIIDLFPFHPITSMDNLLQFIDFQKHRRLKTITHFPACNLGITKKLFIEAGGFPEMFPIGEDILFSQSALRICSNKAIFNRKQIVKHKGRNDISGLVNHNENFGFYRGLLQLKVPKNNKPLQKTLVYSILLGFRRLGYIIFRTLQWNPLGIIKLIAYSPFLIIGLTAWVRGFWKGNDEFLIKENTKHFSSGYL